MDPQSDPQMTRNGPPNLQPVDVLKGLGTLVSETSTLLTKTMSPTEIEGSKPKGIFEHRGASERGPQKTGPTGEGLEGR